MNILGRAIRHARITLQNYRDLPSPPFLVLFINSICNQKCEHYFYWKNLTRRDDLSKEEIFALAFKAWQAIRPLEPHERKEAELDMAMPSTDTDKLISIQTSGGRA